jgi:hypothetical protein
MTIILYTWVGMPDPIGLADVLTQTTLALSHYNN